MLNQGTTAQTALEALNKSIAASLEKSNDALVKATFNAPGSATTGLQGYDLSGPAKILYPVLTPFRNEIPRVGGGFGSQANWRAVTAINTGRTSIGLEEGKRGGRIAVTTAEYFAAYKGIGIENDVNFEAQYAGQTFEDVRALSSRANLESLMLGEEKMILGGNTSIALGTTPTPVPVAFTTGGALATAAALSIICVALTLDGRQAATISGGVIASVNRTNADGTTTPHSQGVAQRSANVTVGVTGPTGRVQATVAPVRGAVAYAWYVGATATNERLYAITGYPGVNITALPAGGNQLASALPAADNSIDVKAFDGLITQCVRSGSGGLWLDRGGVALTPDGSGGIVEFDTVLRRYWDRFRMAPDTLDMSANEAVALTQAMLGNGVTTGAFRIVINPEQGGMMGGVIVATYLNKFAIGTNNVIKIRIHPDMPQGTMMFSSKSVPYPLANIGNMIQIKTRQDYYQIDWPLVSRSYQTGVYSDQVLQHFFPPSMAVLTGVGSYQEVVDPV